MKQNLPKWFIKRIEEHNEWAKYRTGTFTIEDVNLDNVCFDGIFLGFVNFNRCSLQNAKFTDANFEGAIFDNCILNEIKTVPLLRKYFQLHNFSFT